MTAIATPVVGPLTFVGLMAPHVVGLLGIRRVPAGLAASGVAGTAFMVVADSLARTAAFPLQLPTGILASLLAGPFALLLLASRTDEGKCCIMTDAMRAAHLSAGPSDPLRDF